MKKYLLLLLSLVLVCLTPAARADVNLIANGDFTNGFNSWGMDRLNGAAATTTIEQLPNGQGAVRIEVPAATEQPYYINLYQRDLTLDPTKTYKLTFKAKSSVPVEIGLNAKVTAPPFKQLWKQDVALTTEWRTYVYTFSPEEGTDVGSLTLGRLGRQAANYWFAAVSLTVVE